MTDSSAYRIMASSGTVSPQPNLEPVTDRNLIIFGGFGFSTAHYRPLRGSIAVEYAQFHSCTEWIKSIQDWALDAFFFFMQPRQFRGPRQTVPGKSDRQ